MIVGYGNVSHVAAYVCVNGNIDEYILRRFCKKMVGFSRGSFKRVVEYQNRQGREAGVRPNLSQH
jgi:hypothetical protein